MTLVRIVAPHFVAGLEFEGVVKRTAPILSYMRGWDDRRVRLYCARKGWKATAVTEHGGSSA